MMRPVLLLLLATMLSACGQAGKTGASIDLTSLTVDGKPALKLGFGTEGGEDPAIIERKAGGFALVYTGTRSGDRHLYLATSTDGSRFGKAQAIVSGAFSDQSPALVEDAAGQLHLFFASNRSGEEFQLFEAVEHNGRFGTATLVEGFDGVQDLAVAQAGDVTTVVAEVMGAGVLAASRTGDATFSTPSTVAEAGAEPAACAMPNGDTLVAFQANGFIMTCAGRPGSFTTPIASAEAADESRLRDPALAWTGDTGVLAYIERADGVAGLRLKRFDETFTFDAAETIEGSGGNAQGPAIGIDHNGSFALAWGMKTQSGQQGVLVSRR